MNINEVVTQALQANFSEFTEDQAAAVIEAIKANGFVLIQSSINAEMQIAGKQALGLGMFGYDLQDALDAMIEVQNQTNELKGINTKLPFEVIQSLREVS